MKKETIMGILKYGYLLESRKDFLSSSLLHLKLVYGDYTLDNDDMKLLNKIVKKLKQKIKEKL